MQVHSTVYDVFSYPAVDLSTEDSEDVAHNLIQSGTNPILFEVDGNSDYIDLANTFLEFLVQVQDSAGANMVDGRGYVCNSFFHTMIKKNHFQDQWDDCEPANKRIRIQCLHRNPTQL